MFIYVQHNAVAVAILAQACLDCNSQESFGSALALFGATVLIARRDMVSKVSVATDILVTKGYSNFNDPKNPRALITLDSVKATNGAISEALRIRDKGSEAYKKVMQQTNFQGKEQARIASWEATNGGLSKLWDDLCKAGHVICLVVRCPRCDSYEEMDTMQKNLEMLIFKIDSRLHQQCIEIFTSRNDIGTVGETTAICRWPYYLGIAVQNLAASLNIAEIGAHKFKAQTSFEGRAKVMTKAVDPWSNVTIGGIPLAEMTSDQIKHASLSQSRGYVPSDAVMQTLEENHKAILNASHFDTDLEKDYLQIELLIFPEEIDAIQKMKTWCYAQEIIQGGQEQRMAIFIMAGEVINACADKSQPTTCYVLDGCVEWYPNADMFLNNGRGKYFVTFDPPFVLRMDGNGTNLKNDVPGSTGLKVFYCIQYNMLEDGQVTFFKAGIVFAQHVQVNPARLSTLRFTMQEQLTALSCTMAVEGAKWTNAPGTAHQAQHAESIDYTLTMLKVTNECC